MWHARNADEPFLPLPLLSGTVVPYAMVAGGCAMGAMLGLTVHLPLYYEVVYHLSASEAGLALIPLAAISTCGCGDRRPHHGAGQALQAGGDHRNGVAALAGCAACARRRCRCGRCWSCCRCLRLGLGTAFPVSVVSIQNAVARSQVGTITGAMNFFRTLMASFTVAAFTAILLMALGADISLGGEHRGPVSSIPAADMIVAFHYVFGAAAALMGCASLFMILMEEKPLAGPAARVEMAE